MATSSLSLRHDFNALAMWLETFPRMKKKHHDFNDVDAVLQDEAFASDVLLIANEICDESAGMDCARNEDTTWSTICHLLSTKLPECEYLFRSTSMPSTSSDKVSLLSILLCFAVSDDCRQQRAYVESILSLTKEDQKVLMAIIEAGKGTKPHPLTPPRRQRSHDTSSNESEDTKRICSTPTSSSDASLEENFMSPRGQLASSPEERLFFPAATFSPPTVDTYLDNLIKDLQERNERLRQELDITHQREVALGHEIERSGDNLRKEMMKLDSTWLRRVEETRNDYDQEITTLKEELSKVRETNAKLLQREKDAARTSKAELKKAQDSLAQTEERLKFYTERENELERVKKALHQEEDAHSISVEECHRLRDELKASHNLKCELEKFKSQAAEAENLLAEREEDLLKAFGNVQEAEDRCKKLTEELADRTEEVDDLRRQLDERSLSSDSTDSESSVHIARLRHENMRLMDYLAEVEQQSQYELNASEEQIASLQTQMNGMNSTITALQAEIEERTSQLMDSQASLSKTCSQLCAAETKYETLRVDAEKWKKRADDAKIFTSRRKQLLSKLQMDVTNAMDADKETIASLELEVKEWKSMAIKAEDMLEDCQNEHAETVNAMNKFACSLDEALYREEALQQEKEKLQSIIRDLQRELHQEQKLKGKVLVAKGKALKDECHAIVVQTSAKKGDDVQHISFMKLLAKEREVHETQFDLLKNKYQQHLSEIKQQMTDSETKHSRHVNAIMEVAHEERERLVEDYNNLLQEIQTHEAGIEVQNLPEESKSHTESRGLNIEIFEGSRSPYKEQMLLMHAQMSELFDKNKILVETILELENRQVDDKLQAEIASYKKKAEDASKLNKTLLDMVDEMKKEQRYLQQDNDELQKQLDQKLEDFKKVKSQFETLESEFSALLDESRDLKKNNAKISSFQNCVVYALTGSTEALTPGTPTPSFVGTTPAHLRKEYELKVKSMVDEKRTLVTRSNSAVVDMQKALQQAWEADQQVSMLKKELRSARLARKSLQIALESEGIDLGSDLSSSLGDSNDSSNDTDEGHTTDVTTGLQKAPRDVGLLMGNNDIEATPILTPSSSSSSMDIPAPPSPLLRGYVKEKQSIDDPEGGSERPEVGSSPSKASFLSKPPVPPPPLSTLVERLSIEDSSTSASTPKTPVGESPGGDGRGTILSPSSRHNRKVHWNDDKLWVANDGSMPQTPTLVPSPVNDKYCAVMMSPKASEE